MLTHELSLHNHISEGSSITSFSISLVYISGSTSFARLGLLLIYFSIALTCKFILIFTSIRLRSFTESPNF
jgi:hypothetical protein